MMDSISLQTASATFADVSAEPAWLIEHLNDADVRIVEVDVSRAAYDEGHIPGAVLWSAYTDLHHADYSPLESSEFEELLGSSGLAPDDTIVFYGYAAYLGFWLMKAYGHKRALVLHSTRKDWNEAHQPWTGVIPKPVKSTYQLPAETPTQLITLNSLQAALETRQPIILDVRSEAEFVGERFWPSGTTEGVGRTGHIPGAVHMHADLLHTSDGTFESAEVLRQIFNDRGVIPERSIVTYCTIGIRASEAAFVLKYLLGYTDVRVYAGSWAEWGTRKDTPIEI
jgi:thiosulfate/3-mercaptopyruvate sulfurtransferase